MKANDLIKLLERSKRTDIFLGDTIADLIMECKQAIIDSPQPPKYKLLQGSYKRFTFSYTLPISGYNVSTGEHDYNEKRNRWEHTDIDSDGQMYLIISK
jgi:hypothetical protein